MFRSEKPITAVSQLVERITREEYDEDDLSDLPNLIEAIRLQQSTGPTEAARAIRKKLKYGNPHRQIRALTILDDLIRNAGPRFQRSFADEMLLERLRIIATDPLTDTDVKDKCQKLYRQWAALYKTSEGLHGIANLYRQLPQRKRPVNKENSKVLRETEQMDDDDEPGPGHGRKTSVSATAASSSSNKRRGSGAPAQFPMTTSPTNSGSSAGIFSSSKSSKDKKKVKIFNLEKEKPQMQNVISQASIESTNLMNALMHINRESERVSENPEVKKRFDVCKQLRRQTFRYCTLVMDEKYLGTLLHANDQLSDVLVLYEQLDRSFDYDSDSEDYDGGGSSTGASSFYKGKSAESPAITQSQMAALNLDNGPPVMPPRPTVAATAPDGLRGKAKYYNEPTEEPEEEDENDPFADRNEVSTPSYEKRGMDW